MIRRASTATLLFLPATIVVTTVLALPLVLLLRYSFNRFVPGQFMVDDWSVETYVKFFTDPYYLAVLRTTLVMAATVTLTCLVVAFPLAMAIVRAPPRWKPLLIILVVVPLFVGNAVRAAGWMVAFGQKGLVNAVLTALGLDPFTLMYTPYAVFFGIVSVNLPYVVLTLYSVIEGIDPATKDAAASLGAAPFTTWRLVTLPLATPGLLAAGVLCFILAMNAYATPVLLGGPKFQMMAPVVANEVLQQNNWPFGGAAAFVLMVVTLTLTAGTSVLVSRRFAR